MKSLIRCFMLALIFAISHTVMAVGIVQEPITIEPVPVDGELPPPSPKYECGENPEIREMCSIEPTLISTTTYPIVRDFIDSSGTYGKYSYNLKVETFSDGSQKVYVEEYSISARCLSGCYDSNVQTNIAYNMVQSFFSNELLASVNQLGQEGGLFVGAYAVIKLNFPTSGVVRVYGSDGLLKAIVNYTMDPNSDNEYFNIQITGVFLVETLELSDGTVGLAFGVGILAPSDGPIYDWIWANFNYDCITGTVTSIGPLGAVTSINSYCGYFPR